LKYHVTPDGLVGDLYGPVEGHRNDAHLWSESGIYSTSFAGCLVAAVAGLAATPF